MLLSPPPAAAASPRGAARRAAARRFHALPASRGQSRHRPRSGGAGTSPPAGRAGVSLFAPSAAAGEAAPANPGSRSCQVNARSLGAGAAPAPAPARAVHGRARRGHGCWAPPRFPLRSCGGRQPSCSTLGCCCSPGLRGHGEVGLGRAALDPPSTLQHPTAPQGSRPRRHPVGVVPAGHRPSPCPRPRGRPVGVRPPAATAYATHHR